MKVLGLDFETQHDDAKTTPITEIGAVMVDISLDNNIQVQMGSYNTLVYHPDYPPQSDLVRELTGITDDELKAKGILPREAITRLLPLVADADIVMAHNKKFDKTVLESICTRMGIPVPEKEWLCTLQDFNWPAKYTCKKLAHLAYEHGLPMDHRELHRAVNDVDLMFELVGLYDFPEVLRYSREPWVYLQAHISKPWLDGGMEKGAASKLGYSWERAKYTDEPLYPKSWVKRVKAGQVAQEISLAPFRVTVLN